MASIFYPDRPVEVSNLNKFGLQQVAIDFLFILDVDRI